MTESASKISFYPQKPNCKLILINKKKILKCIADTEYLETFLWPWWVFRENENTLRFLKAVSCFIDRSRFI